VRVAAQPLVKPLAPGVDEEIELGGVLNHHGVVKRIGLRDADRRAAKRSTM